MTRRIEVKVTVALVGTDAQSEATVFMDPDNIYDVELASTVRGLVREAQVVAGHRESADLA